MRIIFHQKTWVHILIGILWFAFGSGPASAQDSQLKIFDRVSEFALGTGSGPITLSGPTSADFNTVGSRFLNGDSGPFLILDGNGKDWMTFIGTYDASLNAINITTFKDSSTGSQINLSNGMHTVSNLWIASLESVTTTNVIANNQIPLAFDKTTGSLENGTALPATALPPADLTITQTANDIGLLIDNSSGQSQSSLKILGVPRGDGYNYETMIDPGGDPGILTNSWITINGASGDPVPQTIGGESIYMLGINSDVAWAPTVVIQSNYGPLIRGYNGFSGLPVKTFEVDRAGDAYFAGNIGIQTSPTTSSSPLTVTNPLTVAGGASIGAGYISNNAPSNGLIVQGNVGIGTARPAAPLEISTVRTNTTSATALILTDNVSGGQTDGIGNYIQYLGNGGFAVASIGFLNSSGTNNDTAISFNTSLSAHLQIWRG